MASSLCLGCSAFFSYTYDNYNQLDLSHLCYSIMDDASPLFPIKCQILYVVTDKMLGNLFMSTLLPSESTARCTLSTLELSNSGKRAAFKHNFLNRVGPCTWTGVMGDGYNSIVTKNWKLHSTNQSTSSVVPLEDEEKKRWEECRQCLCSFDFTSEESDVVLGKAFGWVNSPYWGEERRKEVPKIEIVDQILCFLKNLGLSDGDLHKLLKKFPEVLGCHLNYEVKTNVAALEKEWGIKGKTLRSLLLRNPKVLGYNVDCKGDCMAKCTRCWVRF